MKIKVLAVSMLCVLITLPAFGGWVITSKTSDGQQMMYIQNNMIKIADKESDIIFDVNKNMMHFIMHHQKKIWSGTPAEFSSHRNKAMNNMQKMMEQQLAQMPAEQREAMRKMMMSQMPGQKKSAPEKVQVKKTSQTDKIAGYSCQKYEVLANGKLKEEMWIAQGLNIKKDLDMDKFMTMTEHMSKGVYAGDAYNDPKVKALLKKGWSMKNVQHDESGQSSEEVVKVEKKSLPKVTFDLPKGYQPISLDQMYQMGSGE